MARLGVLAELEAGHAKITVNGALGVDHLEAGVDVAVVLLSCSEKHCPDYRGNYLRLFNGVALTDAAIRVDLARGRHKPVAIITPVLS